jgi:hypothetical protein
MIYCFDLDNTLCNTVESDYDKATPILSRIKKVNELYDQGHTIIIETARGNISGKNHYYYTIEQLKNWGLKFHSLRTGVKFNADVFVDDRAINDKDFFNDNNFKESGSGVDTKLILVNRVRKEASNERMEKLIDEINFIKNIPFQFKSHFPEIVYHGVENGTSFYEMQYYALPSLRRLIFTDKLTTEEVICWLNRITAFSIELNKHEIVEIPKTYMKEMHWDRFWTRKKELEEKSSIFENIFKLDKIQINGKEYINAPKIIEELQKVENTFLPQFVGRWSHSDLHFSNILIDIKNNTFKCIDPRGYNYCDMYYDFGKLWHSVNGKYEMVANEMWDLDGSNYSLHKNKYFYFLESLKEILPEEIFFKYSDEDKKDIMRKIEFNEAMHFITLVPFQLTHDGIEKKALVAYFIGVELLNNFYEKYIK